MSTIGLNPVLENTAIQKGGFLAAMRQRLMRTGDDLTYSFIAEWRAEDVHADVEATRGRHAPFGVSARATTGGSSPHECSIDDLIH